MAGRDRSLRPFAAAAIILFIAFGILADGPVPALSGFLRLQIRPARLLSDFTAMEGTGPAFINAACVGLLGLGLLWLNKVVLSGPTLAAVFTMMGFALFGKTVLNCLPIMAGVSLAALVVGKEPREYTLIAMFGTALGPVVSFVAFEAGFPPLLALPASLIIGVLLGLVLPSLAITMLHLHQGYSLYNIGLTAGFIGLFAASLPNAGGKDMLAFNEWGMDRDPFLALAVPLLAIFALGSGFNRGGRRAWKEYRAILKLPGRLPSDFCEMEGFDGAFINAGLLTLAYWAFVALLGAPFNGPVVGGLMTILGFSFFGKTLRNVGPILAGLVAAAFLFDKGLTDSWVILAFLFGSALAPLAGEFGPFIGFVAGFLHLVIVERTGTWHGGMNLYNNGFAAGLTATLIVSVMEWYRNGAGGWRRGKRQE